METISSRIVMPSVNMLPIEDIKDVLSGSVQAKDTNNVAGTPSSQIAIAYNGDREAVKTAHFLGDRAANEFLTIDFDPTDALESLDRKQQNEITGLRLELYRLYEILNKQLGAKYTPESGYLEDFIDTITDMTTGTVVNSDSNIFEIRPTNANFAIAKEYIVVDDGKDQYVTQIASVNSQIYKLAGAINSPVREVKLYKIKGEMLKNTYSFSHTQKDVLSDTIHSVVLGDYAQTEMQPIGDGIATNLQLQPNMLALDGNRDKGILNNIRVFVTRDSLQASSQMICKIYTIERNGDSKPIFDLIGTSKIEDISYNRWVSFKITNNGLPVEVKAGQELLIAFECNTETNSFKIQMGKGAGGSDLHSNRKIYAKSKGEYTSTDSNSDILLGVDFCGYIVESTTPYKDGLYTSEMFINEREDNKLAQLQLKLKNIVKSLVKSSTPSDGYEGFVIDKKLNGSGKMVVGNNIATFQKSNINTLFTDEHIAVYPDDEVYFIPVKAQITATSELFDAYKVSEVMEMAPVRVTGDYVIFECNLPAHVKRFNVQVIYEDNGNTQAAALESIITSLV